MFCFVSGYFCFDGGKRIDLGQESGEGKLTVAAEAKHHGLFAAEFVAEIGAEEDTGEGEAAEEELPFGGALDVAVLHDAGDDGSREDAVGEGDEVVEEPGATGADEGFPVVAQDEAVGDVLFDGAAAVEFRVHHLEAEVEDG